MVMDGEGEIWPGGAARKADQAFATTNRLAYRHERGPTATHQFDRQLLPHHGPRCRCVLVAACRSAVTRSLREWTGGLRSDCMFVTATGCVCSF